MFFAFVLGVDKDVIKIHYYKNIEFLCQNLIDITLEHGRCISQSKKHDLILEMAIVGPEGHLPFVAFSDPHSMVGIGQVKLGEMPSPA